MFDRAPRLSLAFDIVLLVIALGVAVDWASDIGKPVVWGSFVRTSEPCEGKGCVTRGDWHVDGDGVVHRDVLLDGGVDAQGRTRAAYQGDLPMPAAGVTVTTPRMRTWWPWMIGGGLLLAGGSTVDDLHRVRRQRHPDAPATGRLGRRRGVHRPA